MQWSRNPKLVFVWMVAISIGGEFLGDAGVFVFSGQLQTIEDSQLLALGSSAGQLESRLKTVGDKAAQAEFKAGSASTESSAAVTASGNALALARSARREADSFEKDIVSAKKQATEAEAHLAEALQRAANAEKETARITDRLADRKLTDAQLATIAATLKPFAGQEYEVVTFWDLREPMAISNRIASALNGAGWKYFQLAAATVIVGGFAGIEVYVHPAADEGARKAAAGLAVALIKEGIAANVQLFNEPANTPITHRNKIQLEIGTKL